MPEQTVIDKHAEDALRVVAQAASQASKVIADAASEAIKVKNMVDSKDHDLIQRMDEKLDALSSDFKDLKLGTADRIKKLEEGRALCSDITAVYNTRTPKWDSFNLRIEKLENWRGWIVGVFSIIGIVITLVVYIYLSDITRLEVKLDKHIEATQVFNK